MSEGSCGCLWTDSPWTQERTTSNCTHTHTHTHTHKHTNTNTNTNTHTHTHTHTHMQTVVWDTMQRSHKHQQPVIEKLFVLGQCSFVLTKKADLNLPVFAALFHTQPCRHTVSQPAIGCNLINYGMNVKLVPEADPGAASPLPRKCTPFPSFCTVFYFECPSFPG